MAYASKIDGVTQTRRHKEMTCTLQRSLSERRYLRTSSIIYTYLDWIRKRKEHAAIEERGEEWYLSPADGISKFDANGHHANDSFQCCLLTRHFRLLYSNPLPVIYWFDTQKNKFATAVIVASSCCADVRCADVLMIL